MYQQPINIVDGSIYAYLIVDYKTAEILDANQLARNFYKTTNEYPQLKSIFSPTIQEETLEKIAKGLKDNKSITLDEIKSTKANKETFECHIEICKVSDSKLFLVIKETSKSKDLQIKELVELTDNPICVLEHDENLTLNYGNEKYYHSVQQENEADIDKKQLSFLNFIPQEKHKSFLHAVNHEIECYGECDVDVEITFDGEYYQFFRFNAYKSIIDNKLYGVLISAKKQSELMKKIEYDQQYFDIMQKFSKDLLFRIDVKKRTLVHRGDISKFVGLLPEMQQFPESMRETKLIHPDDLEGYIAFAYLLMSGSDASFEPRFQFSNGVFEKYSLQGSPLFDADGNTIQVVGKCENIQKFVDIEAKANYDALTTTLNKHSFKEMVSDMIDRAVERDKFALLFIDLDDFKSVNDKMGHVFGDFVLEAVGKRILNCVRKQDRVGRVGGDEFVVFFQFAPNQETVLERAEAILHSLRREFNHEGQVYKTRASVGISFFPEQGKTYDELYHLADKALYVSKSKGKDIATIYHEENK